MYENIIIYITPTIPLYTKQSVDLSYKWIIWFVNDDNIDLKWVYWCYGLLVRIMFSQQNLDQHHGFYYTVAYVFWVS